MSKSQEKRHAALKGDRQDQILAIADETGTNAVRQIHLAIERREWQLQKRITTLEAALREMRDHDCNHGGEMCYTCFVVANRALTEVSDTEENPCPECRSEPHKLSCGSRHD